MTELTREQIVEARRVKFEEYYTGAFFKGDKEASSKWLARCEFSGGYLYAEPSDAWKAWNAALDSLEIELPEKQHVPTGFYGAGEAMSFNDGIDSCRDAIEAQGVKVKP
jgi:hypothetical protein